MKYLVLLTLLSISFNLFSQNSDLVLIKGGTYLMGQEDGEGDERPAHEVTLAVFYLSAYEVTVAEYRLFCERSGRSMPN